ncbi:hypothetical protein DBY21_00940 [Candidatus Gastranaerophilales bacterium]|nr:MAG: hypothetical protein DBY21_00940 [Candidatus Gastranaerophilales bacterium]
MKLKKIGVLSTVFLLIILSLFGWYFYQRSFGYFVNGPQMNNCRAYHQSILFNNKEILITGGINTPQNEKIGLKSAEIYSINKKEFNIISNTNLPHLYHKMFNLTDKNILIADLNGIEVFNTDTKTFNLLQTKPEKRYPEFNNYKYALLPNNKLLILGGRYECKTNNPTGLCDKNSGEIIDIKEDKKIKKFNFLGNGFGIINLPDGNLLIVGGKINYKNREVLSDKIYLFDTKSNQIQNWGNLLTPQINPFVFLTSNNKLVVIGGGIEKERFNWQGYEYIRTEGSSLIEIIDLKTKQSKTIDIDNILKQKKVYGNNILDVVQYKDNLYWLQLKSTKNNNSLLIDLNTKNTEDIIQVPFIFTTRYRSSNIKIPNGILITGGKLTYQEPTELDISSESHPEVKEHNNADSNRFVEESSVIINLKE